jgi:hypothetical protein
MDISTVPTRIHYLRINRSIEIMVVRLERFDNTLYVPKEYPVRSQEIIKIDPVHS